MEKCIICFKDDKVAGEKYCQTCLDRFFEGGNKETKESKQEEKKEEENAGQQTLFDTKEYDIQQKEWEGMPEFKQEDLTSWKSIIVHFEKFEDLESFGKLIKQKLTPDTRSIWYPLAEIGHYANKRYIDES